MAHNYKRKKKKYNKKKDDKVTLEPKKDDESASVSDILDKIDDNVAKDVAKRLIERTKVVTKEQRHQIEERAEDGYDFDTKQKALRRSDDRCCHCGKPIFVGYGMTLDHFVPLNKGGTNDDVNLIALCDNCNQTKDNYIVAPSSYLPYLKKEEKKALIKYFVDYIDKYECINRNSLLSYDRYDIWLGVAGNNYNHDYEPTEKNKSALRKFSKQLVIIHYLGKSKEEYDELLEYYVGYLKRRKLYENYNKAKGQLDKWIAEKCIYYIKDQSGIVFMSVLWASKLTNKSERINNKMGLNMLMLTKYNTDTALSIYYNFVSDIIYYVRRENKLSRLHLRIICSLEDKCGMYYALCYHHPDNSVKEQSPDFGAGIFNCTYDTAVYTDITCQVPYIFTTFTKVVNPSVNDCSNYYYKSGKFYFKLPDASYYLEEHEDNYYEPDSDASNIVCLNKIVRLKDLDGSLTKIFYHCIGETSG